MNGTVEQQDNLIAGAQGALRRITLNRPKALNALTLDMAVTMTALLEDWASDPAVGAVLIDGAGDRAFCAGGDIRALYDAAKLGSDLPLRFWSIEYRLDLMIARYQKPVVVVMDGMVMGGGVGISAHASHRVVTERSAVAMPEVGIGFFPDVGVGYLLARAPGQIGTHIALTGDRVSAADAIASGLADIHISAADIARLPAVLEHCHTPHDVERQLKALSSPPATPGQIASSRDWIDRCYAADTVEAIVAKLRDAGEQAAQVACATILTKSPTSLKVTLRNLRDAARFSALEQAFVQDLRIAIACIAGHDFIEGVRAAVVDKDRNPRWRPDRLEDVTADIVDRHFRSLGERELTFNK
jgi:enoyl-CoA hydratase